MFDHGGGSKKPHWLYCSHPWIAEVDALAHRGLDAEAPRKMVVKRIVDGRAKVTGGPDLKRSQAYPDSFGRALATVLDRHAQELRIAARM
eukprot:14586647-Alexandrium_andersonii.AAC.1